MDKNQYSELNRRKNTMDDNTNTNTGAQKVQKAKLTGDARTFLIALLTSIITIIAYHLIMESIKFFNDDPVPCPMQHPVKYFKGGHHGHRFHDGDRPMRKARKFRHFKDCMYFGNAECDQVPMKGCKCMERYKKMREQRMQKLHDAKTYVPAEKVQDVKKAPVSAVPTEK